MQKHIYNSAHLKFTFALFSHNNNSNNNNDKNKIIVNHFFFKFN